MRLTLVLLDSLRSYVNNCFGMNNYALISLITAIVFIPLLVILLDSRPWQRRQKLFFAYLVTAMLWSLSSFLLYSNILIQNELLLAKIAICLGMLMAIQLHYFLRSLYQGQDRIPYAYVILAGAIALAALGFPKGVIFTEISVSADYGTWFIALLAIIAVLLGRDIYLLARRQAILADPRERNQMDYLFAGFAVLFASFVVGFTPAGRGYPIFYIGNFAMAGILTYAVVTRQLLDIKVALRRGLVWIIMTFGAVAAYFLLFFLLHIILDFSITVTTIVAAIAAAAWVAMFAYWMLTILRPGVEQTLTGEKYGYRQQLFNLTSKADTVSTLEELGSNLISLLCQSVECRRACLLLPKSEGGDFTATFSYAPVKDNPIQKLSLKQDGTIANWLKQEARFVSRADLVKLDTMNEKEYEDIQLAEVEMLFPLMNQNELIAILAMGEKRNGKFYTVEDIEIIESVASRINAIMERQSIYEQLKEREKELSSINRLTNIVISSMDIKEIFEGFSQQLKEIISIDWAAITLVESEQLCFSALSGTISSPWQTGQRIPLEGTGTQWVLKHGKSLYQPDLGQQRMFWTEENLVNGGIHSVVYSPLLVTGKGIGTLIVASLHPNAYSAKQLQLLEQLASQIAAPIENSRLYTQAEQKARIDDLTGLFNRRHFEERLEDEIARHSRYGGIFSMFILDLDSFKAYNDIYGHLAGDRLLRRIGEIMRNSIRSADQAFRYGGDEFTVILPETNIDDAYVVAERTRKEIASEMKALNITLTCSIGLIHYPFNGTTFTTLMETADAALYYAKTKGGNQSYIHSKSPAQPPTMVRQETVGISLNAIYALTSVVEARDHYTYGHSRKVNYYAVALAKALELPSDEITKISAAASLHDVGKIGITDDILNKKGEFTEDDWRIIKAHSKLGASIVGSVPGLVPCIPAILYHHEHYDGSGYPEGLKGDEIPLEARILSIADAFSAMTSVRPYRGPLSLEQAIEELERNAGTQFDPKLLEVFINFVKSEGFVKEITETKND